MYSVRSKTRRIDQMGHTDTDLDTLMFEAMQESKPAFEVVPGIEGSTITV